MSITARQRPGVYSDYDTSGIIWSSGRGKAVGIVGLSSVKANVAHTITRTSDARTIFGTDDDMYELCRIALLNGALKVVAVSAGTGEEADYQAAFNVLESQSDVYTVICDSTSGDVHALLKASVLSASQNQKERLGIAAYGSYENINSVTNWASSINCERMILTAQNPLDENLNELSGCLVTAAIAGMISANSDPTYSFNANTLSGILSISKNLDEDTVDAYITNGITPLETILNESEIIRLVTSKTKTNNASDTTFKDINTILIVDEVIPGLRNMLKSNILGSKNNLTTRSALETQTIVKLQEYVEAQIIESYKAPKVSVSATDETVCIIEVSFSVSKGLNQIVISANIKV